MSRAIESLRSPKPPDLIVELLAADILREVPSLEPQTLCDVVVTFGRLRFQRLGFVENMSKAFLTKKPECLPRHVAVILHSLASQQWYEKQVYSSAVSHILRNLVGFRSSDLILSSWSFAKTRHKSSGFFQKAQEVLSTDISRLTSTDISMMLWSLSRAECGVTDALLSGLAHRAALECRTMPLKALLVTCTAFARLGFAQQSILIELYRSLYPLLPNLSDAQLAHVFLLFSTSGLRDGALLHRMLYEGAWRLHRLHGRSLSNFIVACSNTVMPTELQTHGLDKSLKQQLMALLPQLSVEAGAALGPLLDIFSAAPSYLILSRDECLKVAQAMSGHIPAMGAAELTRCLLAFARAELMHKPLLLPLFYKLHKTRDQLQPHDLVSCIWSVHLLGFCKPKLRRSLGYMLVHHAESSRIAPRSLVQVMPALGNLSLWDRLPLSLQRGIWRLAGEDQRRCVSKPPQKVMLSPEGPDEGPPPEKPWRLPRLVPGLLRRRMQRGQLVAGTQQLESLLAGQQVAEVAEREEQGLQETNQTPSVTGRTAVDDFVRMVQRL